MKRPYVTDSDVDCGNCAPGKLSLSRTSLFGRYPNIGKRCPVKLRRKIAYGLITIRAYLRNYRRNRIGLVAIVGHGGAQQGCFASGGVQVCPI
jgi:hypothetical protein